MVSKGQPVEHSIGCFFFIKLSCGAWQSVFPLGLFYGKIDKRDQRISGKKGVLHHAGKAKQEIL